MVNSTSSIATPSVSVTMLFQQASMPVTVPEAEAEPTPRRWVQYLGSTHTDGNL